MPVNKKNYRGTYIDLFSGCGGLSLGLGNSGWQGVFAIEKDPMAFETFRSNFLEGAFQHFDWPKWLPQKAMSIQSLLINHEKELKKLKGKVDLIAGGPPCQGFSLVGLRNPSDPRNKLSKQYVKVVKLVKPKFILLENVKGFSSAFVNDDASKSKQPYSDVIKSNFEDIGYKIFQNFVSSERFGVPQVRTRFIMIGVRKDIFKNCKETPFELLEKIRPNFLKIKGFPDRAVHAKEAIQDLETMRRGAKLTRHSGSEEKGFKQLDYKPPKQLNFYQSHVRKGLNGYKPNGLRLARHLPSTIEHFKLIQKVCRPGIGANEEEKKFLNKKKQVVCFLSPKKPSRTLTTVPDDLLHYKEPRILTVRESARIQSFPDNFVFTGNYTTGGDRRTKECPRYTQVGNAVPPLLGEILGLLVASL